MALRFYISSENAPFFNNNTMGYGNSIPTSGTYKVGDFIISSTQQDGIFGWVCTVAGTPGTWEVIGSGNAGSGDGTAILGGGNIVGYFNSVEFTDARNSIDIGIPQYVKGEDFLEVHYNGLLLVEGIHYNVSDNGLQINVVGDAWNKDADDTQQMIFRVIKSGGVILKELNNTVNIDAATTEVEIGIGGFVHNSDIIEVHLNGVLLVEGTDYNIENGRLVKIDQSEPWNMYNVQGQKMFIKVFKNTGIEVKPGKGTVTLDALDPEVLEKMEASMTITDVVINNTENITNIDERLTIIEEKIESGDIVTNGGGGGSVKLTYTDNLVEVVNTNTVAIGLPFNKENDMLEVHIDGLKLAEGVHYNISDDGLSIVKINGVWNPDSLDDQYIDFRVITAGSKQIEHLTNNIEFNAPLTEVVIGLEYKEGDILEVHLNGIKLVEGLDFNYVAEGNKIVKIDTAEPWNLYGVDGQLFVIDVLRNVGEKITMDMLADDIKDAIEGASDIDLSGYVEQDAYNVKITELEGRINEAFTSANNGKQLIASAIGEPVSADDTFSAMSNDINSLLNTFKTNMMNNGIAVESGDKFKALIDKISTMVEEGSGKGIQYASEAINVLFKQDDALGGGAPFKLTLAELDFEPSIVFIETEDYANNFIVISSTYHTDVDPGYLGGKTAPYAIINTTATSKQLYISVVLNGNKIDIDYKTSFSPLNYNLPITYHAIGVGEEDTALRDSLASILQEEGVTVTEEDDMASLIGKVDQEFDRQVAPAGDAVAGDVLSGKTFINNTGQLVTGTLSVPLPKAGTRYYIVQNHDCDTESYPTSGSDVTLATFYLPAGDYSVYMSINTWSYFNVQYLIYNYNGSLVKTHTVKANGNTSVNIPDIGSRLVMKATYVSGNWTSGINGSCSISFSR